MTSITVFVARDNDSRYIGVFREQPQYGTVMPENYTSWNPELSSRCMRGDLKQEDFPEVESGQCVEALLTVGSPWMRLSEGTPKIPGYYYVCNWVTKLCARVYWNGNNFLCPTFTITHFMLLPELPEIF
jgi:hypothetical protein